MSRYLIEVARTDLRGEYHQLHFGLADLSLQEANLVRAQIHDMLSHDAQATRSVLVEGGLDLSIRRIRGKERREFESGFKKQGRAIGSFGQVMQFLRQIDR